MTIERTRNIDTLRDCGVLFDEKAHRYALGKKILSGITGIISSTLFPDQFDGVPREVLRKAAKRGSEVHAEVELLVNEGVPVYSDEGIAFKEEFKDDIQNRKLRSEYIVTDFERVASSIDLVRGNTDGSFDLFDIKTTAVLNTEYVMWQLSVYAWMFELCNPGSIVRNLFAIHLRDGKCELVEVRRIEREHCKKLIGSWFSGVPFVNPLYPSVQDAELAMIANVEESIVQMETYLSVAKKRRDAMLSSIRDGMRENGIRKWETEKLTITYCEETTKCGLDTTRLKKEMPNVYEEYKKESKVSDSVRIKLKEQA